MKNKMSKSELEKRILCRGESLNHCHVVTGDIEINERDQIVVGENSNAVLRHLLEKDWMKDGTETWTGEHHDIKLAPGTYEFVPQKVFDPLSKRIEIVRE